MADREELVSRVLRDLCSGMDDTALMAKHDLSYTELRVLYGEMFHSGMFGQAVHQNFGRPSEPEKGRGANGSSRAGLKGSSSSAGARKLFSSSEIESRGFDRHGLDFVIPVYDIEFPEVHGRVRDINEEGLGVTGISAGIHDVKTLVVLGDEFGEVAPFEFEAVCRWVERDVVDGHSLAGFKITNISDYDLQELRKLIAFGSA